MVDFCYSNNRKKHQRRLNKYCRQLNKLLRDDEIWQGRFECHQIKAELSRFEDGSGSELFVYIRLCDKETQKCVDIFGDDNWLVGFNQLAFAMNWFITEYIATDCRGEHKDYRNTVWQKSYSEDADFMRAV